MKHKIFAIGVALIMAFLLTGGMPSNHTEGRVIMGVEATDDMGDIHAVAHTGAMKVPTDVTPLFAGDKGEAQKAIAIVLLYLLHNSGMRHSLRVQQ